MFSWVRMCKECITGGYSMTCSSSQNYTSSIHVSLRCQNRTYHESMHLILVRQASFYRQLQIKSIVHLIFEWLFDKYIEHHLVRPVLRLGRALLQDSLKHHYTTCSSSRNPTSFTDLFSSIPLSEKDIYTIRECSKTINA